MEHNITIVVPVYKIEEKYLRNCIESIMKQTSQSWEMILVDDGSPDNCGSVCDEYALKDERIRVIHQENQGVSVARNSGIENTRTKWVTFVDPDDWIDESAIEKILDTLSKNQVDILAFGYAREFVNYTKVESLKEQSEMIDSSLLQRIRLAPLYRLIVDGNVISYTVNAIWNKVYRLDFLNEYGIRFEPQARKGQDRVFNLYALDKTDKVYYLNECLYHYRNDNENSIVNRYNKNVVKYSKAVIELMKKWIAKEEKPSEYTDMLNCWICIRLQEYMRLYYFNKNQTESYKNIKKELNQLLDAEPYESAMKEVKKDILSFDEKIFIMFIKLRMFWVCKMLIGVREWLKKKHKV